MSTDTTVKCKCGKELEIKYICGVGKQIQHLIPNSSSLPKYYVKCECGFNDEEEFIGNTIRHRDKAKRDLLKRLKNEKRCR